MAGRGVVAALKDPEHEIYFNRVTGSHPFALEA
jgi:hypothetical protein